MQIPVIGALRSGWRWWDGRLLCALVYPCWHLLKCPNYHPIFFQATEVIAESCSLPNCKLIYIGLSVSVPTRYTGNILVSIGASHPGTYETHLSGPSRHLIFLCKAEVREWWTWGTVWSCCLWGLHWPSSRQPCLETCFPCSNWSSWHGQELHGLVAAVCMLISQGHLPCILSFLHFFPSPRKIFLTY